jgi:hypothetical protein
MRRRSDQSIGSILLRTGFITKSDLLQALRQKQEAAVSTRLGAILVEQGAITAAQLERALEFQRSLRGQRMDYAAITRDLIAKATSDLENLHGTFAELERIANEIAHRPDDASGDGH